MTTAPDTLYLIDGSGYIFRAFHALPPMTRPDGTPVNAVYGFCNMLQKLLGDLKAVRIAVIFDAGRTTFRNEIYADYKAHRPPPPDELIPQFPLIREATRAYGIPALEAANYEADDLIAAYARAAVDAGLSVRIVSADKDLMQLVRPGVELYDPMKSLPIGPAEVEAKFGVPPDKVIDVQALAGDSTDNVPGVPGIGVKTAAQLILEYGDLENLLRCADAIKQPKRRDLLLQYAAQARISKRLVTLDDQAPLPAVVETLVPRADHKAALATFLREQGFRSILARLQASEPAPMGFDPERGPESENQSPELRDAPPPRIESGAGYNLPRGEGGTTALAESARETATADASLINVQQVYECVQTVEQLRVWVAMARANGYVAVDTETSSLTPSTTQLVGVSLATAPGRGCYIPIGHVDPATSSDGGFAFDAAPAPLQLSIPALVEELKDLLTDPAIIKVAHNLKFDLQVLAQHGLDITPYDDTMLLSFAIGAGKHGHGLDELALRHLGHKMISYNEVTGTGKARISFARVPLDKATDYAAEDADYTLRLWMHLRPLIAQQKVARLYERIERPLIPVVAAMERDGILIDPAVLQAQGKGLAARMAALETEVHKLAGHPFNLGSPKQLGEVLFGELGIASGGKGKAGAFSTAIDVLEPLADAHPIVAKILEWRGLSKLKSTYTDALPAQIDAKTGRVHTSFSLVGASTGRLASTDPNLQNIPIRTEDGRAIRQAFIAPPGHELLSVDYSQIELRLAAAAAGIKALIQAFQDGVDVHALTASQVFGIPLKDMTPDRRRMAKAVNFGIIYGISGFGLAKQLGTSSSEAGQFIRQYLDKFHELRDWMETTKKFAHAHGYVETMFGRRIHIAGINEKIAARRGGAERQAINAPLQGTAADIMKRAMIRMPGALAEAGLKARLLLQVHDELVFEVPVGELEMTAELVKKVMQEAPLPAVQLAVPLVAEAGHAMNWAAAH